jgi:antitoxin component YwqK of YwqJK toxin-antitoxin module
MKKLLLPTLVIMTLNAGAQVDTSYLYFDQKWSESTKENAYYYSKIYNNGRHWKKVDYWINTNKIYREGSYSDKDLRKREGTVMEYFESGALKDSVQYEDNKKKAVWYYYENGKNRSYATFNEKGKAVGQIGWDETGIELKDFIVEREAQFPGGQEGWKRYLEKNLNANVAANDRAPAGLYPVKVQFIVDKEGNVKFVKAVSVPELCPSCGEESERIIKKGPKWNPAVQNGKPVIYQAIQFLTYQVAQ